MSEDVRDFHFNVNVRAKGGSKAQMANNEDSFLRAMEIQERKREKKELERLEEEKAAAALAPPIEDIEPELSPDEAPVVQEEAEAPADPAPIANVVDTPPAEAVETPVKPSGGGVPGPKPRSDFSSEEKAAMLKRAKAHAAEVLARKNK